MKSFSIIFGIFFLVTFSGISAADIPNNSDQVRNSRLFQSCKNAFKDNRFETSYCSHTIVSVLSGYVLTLQHYNGSTDCTKEVIQDVRNNSSFPLNLTPKKIVEKFLADIDQGTFKTSLPLDGLDMAETALVESFSKNFLGKPENFSSEPKWFEETDTVWIRRWIKVKDLYLSCAAEKFFDGPAPPSHLISGSREFCEGTIRGLAMGHVLALSILPTYDKSDKCFVKKAEVVERFKKRMCLKGDPSMTAQISMKFVDDIKKMPPERIMSLGSDRTVEWVIAPYIVSEHCRRNLP